MFRSFIYLDEEKLYTYKRQIEGKNLPKPKTLNKSKSAKITASLSGFGISGATETNISSEFEKDISFDYDRLELLLQPLDGEDYFDTVINPEYDLTTVPPMKIIRVCNSFMVPEEFDAINLVDRFKPMLMGQMETQSDSEQEALENILGTASADIPIVIDNCDVAIASKLNTKYLREEYASLEEYIDQDVYLLCKVVGIARKNNVEIFDPLKDFIHLPRPIRRQMADSSNSVGFEKISIEGPVLKVEVIAIYK